MGDETASVSQAVAWAEMNGKFDQMIQSIDTVKDKQEEMADDIAKIKEAIYNPEQGLFSRIREVELWRDSFLHTFEERVEYHTIKNGELRMAQIETTIAAIKRIQWLVAGSVVTTVTALVLKHFILT